jgi:hypothetical protein
MEFKNYYTFETLEGRSLIRETLDKRNPQTFLALILALQVLNDYDPVLSYQVFKSAEQELLSKPKKLIDQLDKYKKKLQLAEAQIAKLKRVSIDINLERGKFLLYGYECNGKPNLEQALRIKMVSVPKAIKHLYLI